MWPAANHIYSPTSCVFSATSLSSGPLSSAPRNRKGKDPPPVLVMGHPKAPRSIQGTGWLCWLSTVGTERPARLQTLGCCSCGRAARTAEGYHFSGMMRRWPAAKSPNILNLVRIRLATAGRHFYLRAVSHTVRHGNAICSDSSSRNRAECREVVQHLKKTPPRLISPRYSTLRQCRGTRYHELVCQKGLGKRKKKEKRQGKKGLVPPFATATRDDVTTNTYVPGHSSTASEA